MPYETAVDRYTTDWIELDDVSGTELKRSHQNVSYAALLPDEQKHRCLFSEKARFFFRFNFIP